MTTTYTTPIVVPDEVRASPRAWGVELSYDPVTGLLVPDASVFVYELAHFDSAGKMIRTTRHSPADDFSGISAAIKNDLRVVHNRVVTVAKARGEIPAGTTVDDF